MESSESSFRQVAWFFIMLSAVMMASTLQGCASVEDQSQTQFSESGEWFHTASGTIIPKKLGDFTRHDASFHFLDAEERSFSVTYRSTRPVDSVLSIVIKPKKHDILTEMDDTINVILHENPGAQSSGMDRISETKIAAFYFPGYYRDNLVQLFSMLMISVVKGWFVKSRLTFPMFQDYLASEERFKSFIKNLPVLTPDIPL